MELLSKKEWFFGAIETEMATQLISENIIMDLPSSNGIFLVRLNNGRRKSLPVHITPFKISFGIPYILYLI
jgi:hypothetical protein